jgi:hypothetical protein
VFLLFHTSHVCQPLDWCPFSVTKAKYRKEVQEIARFDNADKVKKIRFVELYHRARNESMIPSYIKSGWKATALHPWNPQKAMNSSLILQAAKSAHLALKLPPSPSQPVIMTPQNRHQLRTSINALTSNEELSKSVRLLFNKATKALDNIVYEKAQNTIQLRGQQLNLDEVRAKKRRKVAINAQQSFADIKTIKAVKDIADKEEARAAAYERRHGHKAAVAESKVMMERYIEACCNVRALPVPSKRQ